MAVKLQEPASFEPRPAATPAPFNEFSEEYLLRRFSRTENLAHDVTYETTRDVGYLHQYQRLCALHPLTAGEAAAGEALVARIGNHVIGGCRLGVSAQASGELSGLAILPEYEDSIVALELLRHVLKAAMTKKLRHIEALLPQPQLSKYQARAQLFGLRCDVVAAGNATHDDFAGGRLVGARIDLSPLVKLNSQSAARAAQAALETA